MSSPDEPSHVVYAAAAARGQFVGDNTSNPGYAAVRVPDYVADSRGQACFQFNATVTADCQDPRDDDDDLVVGLTSSTLNSPVYFVLTGLPTLVVSGDAAFYLMRAVSGLLCALLLAISASALAQLPRSTFSLTALAISVTPMLLFLGGSVNPNGVEVCAAIAVLSCLLLLGRGDIEPRKLLVERLAMLTVSVFFLVNTRSLSLGWLLFAVAVALCVTEWAAVRRLFSVRQTWIAFTVICVVVVTATAWFLWPKGLGQISGGAVGTDVAPVDAFIRMILISPQYTDGWVGVFGWLDTELPSGFYTIYAVVSASVVAAALWIGRWRDRAAILLLGFAIILLPAIAQALLISYWGWVWQGRYHLALFTLLLIVSGWVLDTTRVQIPALPTKWLTGIAITLVAGVHVGAFVIAIQRYAVGITAPLPSMLSSPQWQPPLGIVPIVILFTLVTATAAALVWRSVNYSTRPPVALLQ